MKDEINTTPFSRLRRVRSAHPSARKSRDDKSYSLTGPETLSFSEMAKQLSAALGRTITFVDGSPEAM
jgi:uncharacterized protein YbjT (DUF2867 family)